MYILISRLNIKNNNPGHNIFEFYNILIQVRFTTSKIKNLITSIANVIYELPHKLRNDLKFRKLGNITKISNLGVHIA